MFVRRAQHFVMRTAVLALVLSMPGFFFNFQPSEPFLTRFLLESKNLTSSQLDLLVWPADVYASLAFQLPVGLCAEVVGYLPTIFVGLLFREATRVILIWGTGVGAMVAMQVTYAAGHAVNAIFFSLPFVFLPPSDEARATAVAMQHGMYHLGNLLGSGLAQILVSTGAVVDLTVLFYISWAATTTGLCLLLCIPAIFKRGGGVREGGRGAYETLFGEIRQHGVKGTCKRLGDLFRLPYVMSASIGLVMVLSCWEILGNYFQENLHEAGMRKTFYGFVELGVEGAFVLGALPGLLLRQRYHGKSFFWSALSATFLCIALLVIATSSVSGWPAVLSLSLFGFFFYAVATGILTTLVSQILPNRFALIFSVLTFLSLALATVLQEIGVALFWETSMGYYVMCGVLAGAAGVFLLSIGVVYCISKNVVETNEEEEKLLIETT